MEPTFAPKKLLDGMAQSVSVLLAWTTEATEFKATLYYVLRFSTFGPFSPKAKRRWLHVRTHEFNDFAVRQPVLTHDDVKRRAVFPRHLNNAVNVSLRERLLKRHLNTSATEEEEIADTIEKVPRRRRGLCCPIGSDWRAALHQLFIR